MLLSVAVIDGDTLITNGSWVIPPIFAHAEGFSDGLARASLKPGLYGYINHKGEWVWRVDR